METKNNVKTFSKTFTGQYTPRGYFSSIEVEIEVDFIGIENQAELDQIIDDGECYDYKVTSIIGKDDDSEWVQLKDEVLYDFQACKIDTIISDKLYYEEQARKNG